MLLKAVIAIVSELHGERRRVARYAVNLIESPKSVEKWVARLWNVSEERGTQLRVHSHLPALQCSFLAFPGRATQQPITHPAITLESQQENSKLQLSPGIFWR